MSSKPSCTTSFTKFVAPRPIKRTGLRQHLVQKCVAGGREAVGRLRRAYECVRTGDHAEIRPAQVECHCTSAPPGVPEIRAHAFGVTPQHAPQRCEVADVDPEGHLARDRDGRACERAHGRGVDAAPPLREQRTGAAEAPAQPPRVERRRLADRAHAGRLQAGRGLGADHGQFAQRQRRQARGVAPECHLDQPVGLRPVRRTFAVVRPLAMPTDTASPVASRTCARIVSPAVCAAPGPSPMPVRST